MNHRTRDIRYINTHKHTNCRIQFKAIENILRIWHRDGDKKRRSEATANPYQRNSAHKETVNNPIWRRNEYITRTNE